MCFVDVVTWIFMGTVFGVLCGCAGSGGELDVSGPPVFHVEELGDTVVIESNREGLLTCPGLMTQYVNLYSWPLDLRTKDFGFRPWFFSLETSDGYVMSFAVK